MPALKWLRYEDLAIHRIPVIRREEYLDYMTFQANDRALFTEIFGPMVGLKEEWEEQGASLGELDFSAFRYRCEARSLLPIETGLIHREPEIILEETAEHILFRDVLGRTTRLMKGVATLPQPLTYPVRNMDDWLKLKPHYQFAEERLSADWEATARRCLSTGTVICVSIPGGFDEPRELMGDAALCLAYYDQPELVHDILDTITKTVFQVLERVSRRVPIDLLNVNDDMAGKSGPLAGPAQVREFIYPYYRKVWDLLAERGTRLFEQNSDGDLRPVIPALLDCGINLMLPLEPAAGMDIVQLRHQYGNRLAFCGGIDKHVLRRTQAEIAAELEYKVPPMLESGGCMLALDHLVPNGVPLENYLFYLRKMWELLER